MSRKTERLTVDHLAELADPVRSCLFWELTPVDRARLVDPRFRDRIVEATVAAVQRMYFPVEQDVPTGSIDVSELRATVPAGVLD